MTEATSSSEILSRSRACRLLTRFFGFGLVNAFGCNGHIGRNGYAVAGDFHEPPAGSQKLIMAVFADHHFTGQHMVISRI